MKLRNTGITPLVHSSGRRINPGDTFNDTGVPAELLTAWRTGESIKPVPAKKPKDEGDDG